LKYILLASLILSTSAFAIDFNKATGTFEVAEKSAPVGEAAVAAAAYGTFEFSENKNRAPASVEHDAVETTTAGINEVTGTFH
jgi:hypothetical protein